MKWKRKLSLALASFAVDPVLFAVLTIFPLFLAICSKTVECAIAFSDKTFKKKREVKE